MRTDRVFGDISNHVKLIKLFKINPDKMLKFSSPEEINDFMVETMKKNIREQLGQV